MAAPRHGQREPHDLRRQEGHAPKRRDRHKGLDGIRMNMTPMIDIVFQLIIFFMLVSEFQNIEMEQITLPYAIEGEVICTAVSRVVVNVNDRGELRLMRHTYTPEQLEGLLRERARLGAHGDGWPLLAVKIRADAECEYKHVQDIMVRCMRADISRVSFGVNHADRETLLEF